MASKGFEPKGRDPYRHQPIPKGKVEWACKQTLSIMSASRLLGVTYNTMKNMEKMIMILNLKLWLKLMT